MHRDVMKATEVVVGVAQFAIIKFEKVSTLDN
jgi:hypothetical protein